MRGYEDGTIDWVAFYEGYMHRPSKSVGAKKRGGHSPFRDGDNPTAFWFNTETGLWKDEVSGQGGNPTTFLALIENIDNVEANKRLCILAGVWEEPKDRKPRTKKKADEVDAEAIKAHNAALPDYSAEKYAEDKGLDLARLNDEFGCRLKTWKNKVVQPYRDVDGSEACTRFRQPPGFLSPTTGKEQRFAWKRGSSGAIVPYGLWLLPTWPADCDIVLIEGESDCHALWLLGIPALGVPGASYFRPDWARYVEGHNVLIHDEQDTPNEDGVAGSVTFIAHTTQSLADADFVETVAVFATPGEYKDPSDLYLAQGTDARKSLETAFSSALPPVAPVEVLDTRRKEALLATRGLRAPQNWSCNKLGVKHFDEKTKESVVITTTPVVLSRRVIDTETGEERIGLAFLRDNKWTEVVASREAAFSARNIIGLLAPLGVQITSESARGVVTWLGALEQANMETLSSVKSARTLGWCGEAFLPTNPSGIVLDVDGGCEDLVAAFRVCGDLESWKAAMAPHRESSPIFRFGLAAGFAAPLLKVTHGRNFFVYNWGASKGGKTAMVKAALSAWGDADVLMATFNATLVGLERMAGLLRDLPFGLDERQAAGGDQKKLDEIVYSLANGIGRVRGARDGGLQATSRWRSVILSTGEIPLSSAVSQTGVATRVLELPGVPFKSEDDAAAMHKVVTEHHGHAGPEFVRRIVASKKGYIERLSKRVSDMLVPYATSNAKSHLAGIATVCVADMLASMWLWDDDEESALRESVMLGITILALIETEAGGNVDESACQWVEDWLRSNVSRFTNSNFNVSVYGERRDNVWLIYPSVLREAMERSGFNFKKTMRALDDRGALKRDEGKFTTVTRVHGDVTRCIHIKTSDEGALVFEKSADVPF